MLARKLTFLHSPPRSGGSCHVGSSLLNFERKIVCWQGSSLFSTPLRGAGVGHVMLDHHSSTLEEKFHVGKKDRFALPPPRSEGWVMSCWIVTHQLWKRISMLASKITSLHLPLRSGGWVLCCILYHHSTTCEESFLCWQSRSLFAR
jgi:hypothetical protein